MDSSLPSQTVPTAADLYLENEAAIERGQYLNKERKRARERREMAAGSFPDETLPEISARLVSINDQVDLAMNRLEGSRKYGSREAFLLDLPRQFKLFRSAAIPRHIYDGEVQAHQTTKAIAREREDRILKLEAGWAPMQIKLRDRDLDIKHLRSELQYAKQEARYYEDRARKSDKDARQTRQLLDEFLFEDRNPEPTADADRNTYLGRMRNSCENTIDSLVDGVSRGVATVHKKLQQTSGVMVQSLRLVKTSLDTPSRYTFFKLFSWLCIFLVLAYLLQSAETAGRTMKNSLSRYMPSFSSSINTNTTGRFHWGNSDHTVVIESHNYQAMVGVFNPLSDVEQLLGKHSPAAVSSQNPFRTDFNPYWMYEDEDGPHVSIDRPDTTQSLYRVNYQMGSPKIVEDVEEWDDIDDLSTFICQLEDHLFAPYVCIWNSILYDLPSLPGTLVDFAYNNSYKVPIVLELLWNLLLLSILCSLGCIYFLMFEARVRLGPRDSPQHEFRILEIGSPNLRTYVPGLGRHRDIDGQRIVTVTRKSSLE